MTDHPDPPAPDGEADGAEPVEQAEPDSDTIDPNTELLREIRDELRAPRA